ncbi:MAG: hypothetical protein IJM29_04530 [Bacteroidales bacterium]|nr:hypothetical protein [Bacteroidales bacterium]
MRTIDVAQILSPDLKSRVRVNDLKLFIENSKEDEVILDFSNIKFATRSFIDEFYNAFLKSPELNPFKVEITNVPEDINEIFKSVSNTQTHVKIIPSQTPVRSFKSAEELIKYLSTV